eukprot:m.97925 g.97925  ORF g.97925 m.97925 type:complete len:721 (+) comp27023_c0_seq1:270-2432(+)
MADDNVKVAVRCRPLSDDEVSDNRGITVDINSQHGSVSVKNPKAPNDPPKTFRFDMCFDMQSKQLDVYNRTARDIVAACLDGYNGTIFAYGQTGTGKTFSMEGVRGNPELQGIIPNSFAHIFGVISQAKETTRFLVRCSYLEIYCEDVRDLLGKDQTKKLQVKGHGDKGIYVQDLSSFVCKNADDMDRIMTKGNSNRMVGQTKMNAHSSRSHAIFTVTIERSDKTPDGKSSFRSGKLNLVDLAGSERQGKTGAEGQRLKEATKINLSLTALGNVIAALVSGGKGKHIPYRDSSLTRLLQDSLGGNSRTVMIAAFGPADYNYEETVVTLRYANRAKQIKNCAVINESPQDAMLRKMQEEIDRLQAELGDEGGNDESSDEEDSSDDDEGTGKVGWDGLVVTKKGGKGKRKGRSRMSPTKLKEKRDAFEKEIQDLEQQKNMAEDEKAKKQQKLEANIAKIQQEQKEREALNQKLLEVQGKMIVGGVNLLEKVEEQQRLLEQSAKELKVQIEFEEKLRSELKAKEEEEINMSEQYKTLEDEITGKTKKMKKLWGMLSAAKSEISELQNERQEHKLTMMEAIKAINKDRDLAIMMIESFIPTNYLTEIEKMAVWDEGIGEWNIPGIAHTGNASRVTALGLNSTHPLLSAPTIPNPAIELDLEKQYFVYNTMVDESRPPKTARSKNGTKTKNNDKEKKRKSSTDKGDKKVEEYPQSRPTTSAGAFR